MPGGVSLVQVVFKTMTDWDHFIDVEKNDGAGKSRKLASEVPSPGGRGGRTSSVFLPLHQDWGAGWG